MLRLILFTILVFIVLSLPPWLFIPAVGLYVLLYTPYELIILGACIDAYFSPETINIPYYTLGFCGLILVSVWLKSILRLAED